MCIRDRRSGLPITAVLVSREHYDLADLPAELAGEFGRLLVVIAAAIEALPSVGRAHLGRYGDFDCMPQTTEVIESNK